MSSLEDRQADVGSRAAERESDHALMAGIAARDPEALKKLYDRHSGMVMALCRRVLHDSHESEDLLVDIFQEVWVKFDRYDVARANPVGYLVMLTRSRAIDRKRRRRGPVMMNLADYDTDSQTTDNTPAGNTQLIEERAIVSRALQSLQADQRQVLECAYYDGLSHSEIAEKLGKPLGTVKTYIRQGLMKLRDALGAGARRT